MDNCGIYCFTNKINNKKYIGQSVDLKRRHRDHLREAYNSKNNNYNCLFYQAIRKYGINNFDYQIIELCEEEYLDEKEIYWISYYDSYKNGYNMTSGGKDNLKYIGKKVLQYNLSGDFIKEYESVTQAAKELNTFNSVISACCRGETATYMNFQFKYKDDKDRTIFPIKKYAQPKQRKAVLQYDLNGIFIKKFNSLLEAEKETGINNIGACCREKQLTAGGYQWALEEDNKQITPITVSNHDKLGKPVYQYDLNGHFIKKFKSQAEAARSVNGFQSNIQKCCANKIKTYKGYIWKSSYIEGEKN